MAFKRTYKPFGKQAILIEWDAVIHEDILKDILFFKDQLLIKRKDVFTDIIVGYHSLTIKLKKEVIDFDKEIEELKSIYTSKITKPIQENYIWEIPVCYDLKFGIDLEEMSNKSNLSIKKIIQLHSEKTYHVFFIGFLPGFLYLGGLDTKLHFERKQSPRLHVTKGAVAIGGAQTGLYPSDSPGGWNIIGKTPIQLFDTKKENPCFAKAGDKIKFTSVSIEEFYQLEKKVTKNKDIISKTVLND